MPRFNIIMKAEEWQGVAAVYPLEGRYWALKCRCLSCRDVTDNYLFVDPNEAQRSSCSGERNCVSQCHFCKNTMSVNVSSVSPCSKASHRSGNRSMPCPGSYCPDEHTEGGTVEQLDIRGAEPVELQLDNQWVVKDMSGVVFKGVDLSDDWYDYNEAAGSTVSIRGVSISFHRVKK